MGDCREKGPCRLSLQGVSLGWENLSLDLKGFDLRGASWSRKTQIGGGDGASWRIAI